MWVLFVIECTTKGQIEIDNKNSKVSLETKMVKVQTERAADDIKAIIAKCGKETTFVSTDDGSL